MSSLCVKECEKSSDCTIIGHDLAQVILQYTERRELRGIFYVNMNIVSTCLHHAQYKVWSQEDLDLDLDLDSALDFLHLQAMEVGVHLNLICSRIDELSPGLSNFVTEIESNLSTAHSPWSDFVRSFTVIVKNAEIASEAQSEGLESQASGFEPYLCLDWTQFPFFGSQSLTILQIKLLDLIIQNLRMGFLFSSNCI